MITEPWASEVPTALLVLADGTVIEGRGLGAAGSAVAEVCFNTALTGYEEILTDPSYAGQIVTFTFPHIGNVGANDEDIEDLNPGSPRRRVRGNLQGRHHQPVELSRRRSSRPMAEAARRDRAVRHRHTRADGADPRKGHAQRGHRARPGRTLRYRRPQAAGQSLAGPGRPRPCQGGYLRPVVGVGRDAVDLERGLWHATAAVDACRCRRLRHQAQHPAAALPASAPR